MIPVVFQLTTLNSDSMRTGVGMLSIENMSPPDRPHWPCNYILKNEYSLDQNRFLEYETIVLALGLVVFGWNIHELAHFVPRSIIFDRR